MIASYQECAHTIDRYQVGDRYPEEDEWGAYNLIRIVLYYYGPINPEAFLKEGIAYGLRSHPYGRYHSISCVENW